MSAELPAWKLRRENTHVGWKLRVVDECGDTVCELKRLDERWLRDGRIIVSAREMYERLTERLDRLDDTTDGEGR